MRTVPVPVLLDSDAGIDDAVALALAARSPETRLVAVTTTFGNATLADTTANARRVLALAGRPDVPVLAGADRPLVRPASLPSEKHGPGGRGYAAGTAGDGPVARSPTALLDALARAPADRITVLVTLGPFTNLAHALEAGAALVRSRIRRHLVIAEPPGEGRDPSALPDFNSSADPDAADRVFAAGLPTEVVPPAVTRRFVVPAASVGRLSRDGDPLARWLADALRWYVEMHARLHGLDGCWLHDAMAVAEAVRPGTLDFAPPGAKIGPRVARGVDLAAARSLLERVFGSGWDGTPTRGT